MNFVRLFIKQPIDGIDDLYSLIVAESEAVERYYRFRVIVAYAFEQRRSFFKGRLIVHRGGDLIIVQIVVFSCDKVYFRHADLFGINAVTAAWQFKIDCVFRRKSEVIPLPCEQMPAKSEVDDIHFPIFFKSCLPSTLYRFTGYNIYGLISPLT